jgi:hypothetical protein
VFSAWDPVFKVKYGQIIVGGLGERGERGEGGLGEGMGGGGWNGRGHLNFGSCGGVNLKFGSPGCLSGSPYFNGYMHMHEVQANLSNAC